MKPSGRVAQRAVSLKRAGPLSKMICPELSVSLMAFLFWFIAAANAQSRIDLLC